MTAYRLKPHQIEGSRFLAGMETGALFDQPRVGKTGSALWAANKLRVRLIVVVCPAHVIPNWTQEVRNWRVGAWTAVIVSYNKCKELVRKLRGFVLDLVVIDEGHMAKNPRAQRTQSVYGVSCNRVGGLIENARRVWVLTGTPKPHSSTDLWPMLRALAPERISDPKRHGKPYTYSGFAYKFCRVVNTGFGVKIDGSKNSAELRERMKGFYLKRTRREVFGTDMVPPTIEYVRATKAGKAELQSLMATEDGKKVARVLANGGGFRELAKMEKQAALLRRLCGLLKVPGVAALVAQELLDEPKKKIIIGAIHHDVIDAMRVALSKFKPLVYDGRVAMSAKPKIQAAFMNGFSRRVIIGNITAMGTGIDCSAADDVLFLEQSWVGDDNEQFRARAFNLNKSEPTFTRFAVLAGSVDEDVVRAAARKLADSEKLF